MGRKRTRFAIPTHHAPSVRMLWQEATSEEQLQAHRLSMAVLEYWLGKASKSEIARRLEIPPLRVWQLSQMALSGMLAGLLRQPRTRPRGRPSTPPASPEDDPRILKQQIRELERKLARTEDLVRVLRDLPWASKPAEPKEESRANQHRIVAQRPRKRRGLSVSPRDEAARGSAAADHAPGHETPADAGGGREPALGA
jgi:hypothetical protein